MVCTNIYHAYIGLIKICVNYANFIKNVYVIKPTLSEPYKAFIVLKSHNCVMCTLIIGLYIIFNLKHRL